MFLDLCTPSPVSAWTGDNRSKCVLAVISKESTANLETLGTRIDRLINASLGTILETIIRLSCCVEVGRACCHIDPSVDPTQNLPPGLKFMPRPFLPGLRCPARCLVT